MAISYIVLLILELFRFPPARRLPVDREGGERVCRCEHVHNIVMGGKVHRKGEESGSQFYVQTISAE